MDVATDEDEIVEVVLLVVVVTSPPYGGGAWATELEDMLPVDVTPAGEEELVSVVVVVCPYPYGGGAWAAELEDMLCVDMPAAEEEAEDNIDEVLPEAGAAEEVAAVIDVLVLVPGLTSIPAHCPAEPDTGVEPADFR